MATAHELAEDVSDLRQTVTELGAAVRNLAEAVKQDRQFNIDMFKKLESALTNLRPPWHVLLPVAIGAMAFLAASIGWVIDRESALTEMRIKAEADARAAIDLERGKQIEWLHEEIKELRELEHSHHRD